MTPEAATGVLSLVSMLKDLTAFSVLGIGFWLLLDGRLVTRAHLNDVVQAEREKTAIEAGEKAEWKRLATRGTDEIIVPLASAVRVQVRDHIRELRGEAREP